MSKENVPPVAGFGRGPHVNARAKSEKQPVVRRRKAAAKADTQPDAAALNAITHPSVAFLFDPERSARPPARPGGLRRPPPFQLAPADSRAAPAGTRSSRRHTGSLETRECTRRGRWASGRSSAATRPCRTACAGWQNTPSSSTPTAWYPPPPHTHRPPPPAAFRLPPSAPRRGPLAAASNGRALNAGARASAQVGKAEYMRVHKAVCRVLAPKMGADEATASAESGVPCPAAAAESSPPLVQGSGRLSWVLWPRRVGVGHGRGGPDGQQHAKLRTVPAHRPVVPDAGGGGVPLLP